MKSPEQNEPVRGGPALGLVPQPRAEHAVHLVPKVGDVAQPTSGLGEPGRQRVLADDQDAADDEEARADERDRDQHTVADRR